MQVWKVDLYQNILKIKTGFLSNGYQNQNQNYFIKFFFIEINFISDLNYLYLGLIS
jgi:hypothetical protein